MNDLRHPCERWAEPITLAAAGCLSPDEEREVRRHIETCFDCRARFRQLTQLSDALAELRSRTDSAETANVERIMSAVASDQSQRPLVRTRAETIPPALLTRSLDTWRWIMRSPVSRVAAAAVFVLAIAGVALWFHVSGTRYAFADFIKPILEAKSAKFKVTFEHDGKQAATANIMVSAPNRVRMELQRPGQPVEITISDKSKGVSVMIDSAKRIAVINKMVGLPREQASMNLLDEIRSWILDAKKPDVKRESLGEKEVDGHRAVGWRLSGPGLHEPGVTVTIWGDSQTGLPIRMECSYALTGQKSTLSECILNPDFDESMFNLDPPAGYRVVNIQTDLSPVAEKDLTETLRRWGEAYGAFPDTLNIQAINEIGKRLPKKDGHKIDDLRPLAVRGFGFMVELPPEADAHYAGKGVSLGKADTPIFWYRPKDAKKYRVIYADLSVRDADTPPNVPKAQPMPAPSSPKQ
jgi:outer membrane lipoprotein-sorting protein